MEFKTIMVTPKIAKTYLEANTRNRNVKQPVVFRYAQDMKSGKWKTGTAEFIKISKTGAVLDGQHRLLAVIESNTTINFPFALGMDDDVFDVLDTGSTRNAADVFKIEGIKHCNVVPSIISLYYGLKTGRVSTQKHNKLTNAGLLSEYEKRPEYWQGITKQAMNSYLDFSKILAPSFIGGFHAFLDELNPNSSSKFIDELTSGANISNNSILALRQKLITNKLSIQRLPKAHVIVLTIKAWNYYNAGKEVKRLFYDHKKESYPIAYSL